MQMLTVTAVVSRSSDSCWRAFTDAAMLGAWLPGLRRAQVISTWPDGLPREVHFEFSTSLTYSLEYRYDLEAREVRWEPRVGRRDAVRGAARFEPVDGTTRVTYSLDQGDGRSASDLALGDPQRILDAFVAWMQAR
jgi:hypothetical protein